MILGSIKTKDILFHPITVISAFGLICYLKLLLKSISNERHFFLEILYKD